MSKQTTEELVKRLLNAEPGARQEAARVIEAMGKNLRLYREAVEDGVLVPSVRLANGTLIRWNDKLAKARAATDEVIDLKTQEDGR